MVQARNLLPIPQRLLGARRAARVHDGVAALILAASRETYDVVHTWPLAAERTLRVARARNWLGVREAPNTHTAHAFRVVAEEHQALGMPAPRNNTHAFDQDVVDREVREYDLAGLILAPSELAIDTFAQNGVSRDKVALKSYGFDPRRYRSHAGAHPDRPVTFAFVARCEPRKGLHLALRAWRNSGIADRSRFHITGRFMPDYRERLSQLLDHQNISESDFVDDLRPIYEAADVLVLPSIEDGSALVTYEAQASGCALLVSDASGARLTNAEEGFVHRAGDIDTLAQQMRLLVEDPSRLLRMQNAAVLNAQKYTWEKATDSLIASYKNALSLGNG